MKLQTKTLKKLVQSLAATRSEELDCDDCQEQIDQFAEMTLAGKDTTAMLPLVEDHLRRCGACREEFEALLTILEHLEE